jgi:hypothetical protein
VCFTPFSYLGLIYVNALSVCSVRTSYFPHSAYPLGPIYTSLFVCVLDLINMSTFGAANTNTNPNKSYEVLLLVLNVECRWHLVWCLLLIMMYNELAIFRYHNHPVILFRVFLSVPRPISSWLLHGTTRFPISHFVSLVYLYNFIYVKIQQETLILVLVSQDFFSLYVLFCWLICNFFPNRFGVGRYQRMEMLLLVHPRLQFRMINQ